MNREKEIFERALDLSSAEERMGFLKAACGGDAAMLERLLGLLRASEGASAFLPETPQGGATLKIDLPASGEEALGTRISHYKLLQKVGEGGCGVVYMAEQEQPVRRRVALKVIKLGMDTRSVVARFEAERQALAMMDHPNIARVLDAGTTDKGRPFFVMELVRGIRITDYCDQNHLSTRARLELFISVCQAVKHAHQKGIIHRDLKPSNILVTLHDGVPVPKVIDFGIAKAIEQKLTDKTLFTELHQFIGTPAYMSPEQAEMSGLDIDTRSDIYSLGVLLYELLTGGPPFDEKELLASGIDGMRKTIRERDPVRPSTKLSQTLVAADVRRLKSHATETPSSEEEIRASSRRLLRVKETITLLKGDLDWIVMKCLEKDRSRRYDTANGLATDIKRHLQNETVIARPPNSAYRFQKLVRRNKLAFTATVAVAAALLLGIIASTWQAAKATRARQDAELSRQTAMANERKAIAGEIRETELRKRAQAGELTARWNAYASDMNAAKQAIDDGNYSRAIERLNRQRPKPGQADLRGWEWRYLWQQARSDALFTLPREAYRQIVSLAVSHDGRWLAAGVGRQTGLTVWDLRTKQEAARLATGEKFAYAAFSPTQPLLAFSSLRTTSSGQEQNLLHFWDTDKQQMIAELPLDDTCFGVAFSTNGSTLATCTGTEIALWQVPCGTKISAYQRLGPRNDSEGATDFAVTPDLALAAYGSDRDLRVVDLRHGKELWAARPWPMPVMALAFSPDGKTLAGAGGYEVSEIRLWDVATGKETGRLEGHTGWTSSLMFWPDGKKLASSSADQTIRIWDLTSQKCVDVLRGPWLEIWRVVLLPDGKTLVSSTRDGWICFWDTSVTHPRQAFVTLPVPVARWRFAPDSQSILALDHRAEVALWRGPDFQQKERLLTPGDDYDFDVLSDDARLLATHHRNGVVRVWDLSSRKLLHEWTCAAKKEQPLRIQAGGDKLVTWSRSDNLLHERETTTGLETQSWPGPAGYLLGFGLSPDAQSCLSFGEGNDVVARNLATKSSSKLNLKMEPVVGSIDTAFSPNGQLFAVANSSGFAQVWDTATWRDVVTLRGYLKGVHALSFSPDSRRLVTGSSDHDAIRLWAAENWQDVLTLNTSGFFYQPAFSPDGNILGAIANGSGYVLHLWRAPSWEEIATAEAMEEKEGMRPQ